MRGFLRTLAAIGALSCTGKGHVDADHSPPSLVATDAAKLDCRLDAAVVGADGGRRLAVLVGVGDYADAAVPDLAGPKGDVARMYELLTGADGYGFPKENVCVLTDAEATGKGVRDALERGLRARLTGDKDVFVFYYSGHGTQVADQTADESDQRDEALVLQDALVTPEGLLVDDEFNGLLAAMQATGAHGTVILDSCHSGSATRDPSGVPRFVELAERLTLPPASTAAPTTDRAAGFTPAGLGGLVVLTAAIDGTSALERGGEGLFTKALVATLAEAGTTPLTWAQVAARLPILLAAQNTPQIPWVQGNLGELVFSDTTRVRPLAWHVKAVGETLAVEGPPLPGFGAGAMARVYPGTATLADFADPARARGVVEIVTADGLHGTARRTDGGTTPFEVGDLVVLLRPGTESRRQDVSLRTSGPGALPAETATALQAALKDLPAVNLVTSRSAAAFEVFALADGRLAVAGPEGAVRNRLPAGATADVVHDLELHARQSALRLLRGEGGATMQNDKTLQVRVVPHGGPSADAAFPMVQAAPNTEQVLPLCQDWAIEVTLDPASPERELAVGGVVLFNDGTILGLPMDGQVRTVTQGGRLELYEAGYLKACPPTGIVEQVVVVGTRPDQPVSWSILSGRSKSTAPGSALQAVLADYLEGTKGVGRAPEPSTPWTTSVVPVRVEVNPDVRAPAVADSRDTTATREYTVKGFDTRPYTPEDPAHPMARLLEQMAKLSAWRGSDGAQYAQHAWSKGTDKENLDVGIDCSRSMWFIFTRASLPYVDAAGDGGSTDGTTKYKGYVSTWKMKKGSPEMSAHFDDCSADPVPRTGDVLVYHGINSKGSPVGHTVMVIDPERFIAWGSHGWDGSTTEGSPVRTLLEPPLVTPTRSGGTRLNDSGVEFQMTLEGHDWQFWDSSKIARTGCWRHRDLDTTGLPNDEQLLDACGGACQTAE